MIEKALQTLNKMQKQGIIGRYAIGGAIASHFYVQPFLTLDMDVFISLLETPGGPTPLSMIHEYLRAQEYRRQGKYILIGRVPIEFIHTDSPLLREALDTAAIKKFRGIPTRVFRPEYMVAIALQTGRLKDLARIEKFLDEAELNMTSLRAILHRHGLLRAWRAFIKKYRA